MRTIRLCQGMGKQGESHCVMAATSIVADEEFSDDPDCVCSVIRHALVQINDFCPSDEMRERLLSHLPWLIIGTVGERSDKRERAELFVKYLDSLAPTSPGSRDDRYTHKAHKAYLEGDYDSVAVYTSYAVTERAGVLNECENDRLAYKKKGGTFLLGGVIKRSDDVWEAEIKKFVDFIEDKIIPVCTTMTIEPEYNFDKLVTCDG